MRVDHIALQVPNPQEAAMWYVTNFGAELVYSDETWGIVQFENIKLAFVVKSQHPAHFAFKVDEAGPEAKPHRDGSRSTYKRDPWGNIYELIEYPHDE